VRDDGDSKEEAMMYYVVTEGRANALDRLNLRDRSRYGLDWMVFGSPSGRLRRRVSEPELGSLIYDWRG
jgi:hypothetical protein